MVKSLKILLWRTLAVVSLLLAAIGAFLPVMPTVPFVLLAAWAASQGWPRLEAWLLRHRTFGPHIHHWRLHGAVSRKAKWFASGALAFSAVSLQFMPLPSWAEWARWGAPLVFVAVLLWMWRRPEPYIKPRHKK